MYEENFVIKGPKALSKWTVRNRSLVERKFWNKTFQSR